MITGSLEQEILTHVCTKFVMYRKETRSSCIHLALHAKSLRQATTKAKYQVNAVRFEPSSDLNGVTLHALSSDFRVPSYVLVADFRMSSYSSVSDFQRALFSQLVLHSRDSETGPLLKGRKSENPRCRSVYHYTQNFAHVPLLYS